MNGAGKRAKRKMMIKTDIPIHVPKRWKNEEMEKLLHCLMENGHKDFIKMQECLPGRTLENIKSFMRTTYDTAGKLSGEHPNLDAWINRCMSLSSTETPWRDSLQIAQVLKYLSVDGLVENHPLPERSQGINFSEAYRMIYQALMGYPIQPVNEATTKFIQETITELSNSAKNEKDAIKNLNSFLKEQLKPKNSEPSDNDTTKSTENAAVENPELKRFTKVYQRKRPKVVENTDAQVPSLKIVVEANTSEKSNSNSTQDFSITILGNENKQTVVNVPVPVKMQSQIKFDKDEQQLLQSTSYNPFQIPEKWLQEPVYLNLENENRKMGVNEGNKVEIPTYNAIERGSERISPNYFTPIEPTEDVQQNEVPAIVPCYNGKSLKIHEELVVNGLCAISIKHHKGKCKDDKRVSDENSLKKQGNDDVKEIKEDGHPIRLTDLCYKNFQRTTPDMPECLKDKMKRRNSFWNVHRPELSKLTWPANFVSSAILQDFFHNHLRIHGTFCEPLHEPTDRSSMMDEEFRDYSKLRELVPPRVLPPDEKVVSIMEKSRSVQLNDEDLDPETMVHKSRAEFCVTIGEYIRRPPLKRTTSQQMPKCLIQQANRFESLPIQHEGLLSKEAMISEERISSIIGNTDYHLNPPAAQKLPKLTTGNISGIVLRRISVVDSERMVATSPPSLYDVQRQYNDQVTEDGGDPARLRTILSPRDEITEESGSSHRRT